LKTKQTVYFWEMIPSLLTRRRSNPPSGFTLLEVMVSLSIIAIALLAVYGNYSQTISMNIDQKFNTTAPLLAARIVADFENRPLAEISDESGDFGVEFDGYSWETVVETVSSEMLGSIADDLQSIGVTVSFNGDEKVFHCKTVRFMRKGTES